MILDCTLRDGGYYVNWDFDEDVVRKYLAAVSIAKIDVIEIGLRVISTDKFLGAFAFSTDDYLNTINLPGGTLVAVMVNASELFNYKEGVDAAVNHLFSHKKNSPVDIVRIATRVEDIDLCCEIADKIHQLGYRVFLNLMQIDSISENEFVQVTKKISSWSTIEVLYLADSLGSMEPKSIRGAVNMIKKGWYGSIGIHAHDNKGLALLNSMAALEEGVEYVDATILGMGRGAGNTKMEYLLMELVNNSYGMYFPDALFPLALQEFSCLHNQYQWGPSIYYYLSATHRIHPTYIQEMLSDQRYSTDQILSAINFLRSTRRPFFSIEHMLKALSGVEGDEHGAWSASSWMKGRTVLILGSGPSTEKYIESLLQYVAKHNPIVLCLNVNKVVPAEMIDAYVACHEMRILIESDSYVDLKKPLIIPMARVPKNIQEALQDIEVWDYGLRIEEGSLLIEENGCVMGAPLALMYAISIATAGKADQILLSGIDGYVPYDPRHQEMVNVIEEYETLYSDNKLIAITPTTFPMCQRSIYDPYMLEI
jgi:4-hydroxy 2-oxovalerate aldolase